MTNQKNLLDKMKNGEPLCLYEQITMIVKLSIPAILAQISSIVMQYIDASMVGQLGADDSASIGLVSSSTWMFGGLCMALSTGFTVQIAQKIGAKREQEARSTVKTGLVCAVVFGLFLLVVGAMISQPLPYWLGGDAFICPKASIYFLVYALAIPITNYLYSAEISAKWSDISSDMILFGNGVENMITTQMADMGYLFHTYALPSFLWVLCIILFVMILIYLFVRIYVSKINALSDVGGKE